MSATRAALLACLSAALLLAPTDAAAQKAVASSGYAVAGRVNDMWVEYDVWSEGQFGMMIHIDFDVDGLLNVPCRAVAYFAYDDGEPLLDFDELYTTTDGQASSGTDFTPIYDSANFTDLRIFMPYDQLHMAPGESDLSFHVEMYTHSGQRHFLESEPVYFTLNQGK